MSVHMTLKVIDSVNWKSITDSQKCILVLGKSSCPNCLEWEELLSAAIINGFRDDFVFAKVLLDNPSLAKFKMKYTWINDIDIFPHTALLSNGERKSFMSGKGIDRLLNLIEQVFD